MTVDLMCFPKIDDQKAIQEAASQGLQSMDHLIHLLSQQQQQHNNNVDCSEITNFTVSKFKKVISLLKPTGHARFRRGPVHSTSSTASPKPEAPNVSLPASVTLDFSKPTKFDVKSKKISEIEFITKENFSVSLNSSNISSAVTGDGSVSNGKGSSIFIASAPSKRVTSSGKPPLPSHPYKRKCLEQELSVSFSGKTSCSGNGECHCKKRGRKNLMKRTVRVPAISEEIANIPSDEYSWRKYGEKSIKGSPHKRGYYRCTMFRNCPARKHVERALDDPTMLIVTYRGEHLHQ